MPPLEELLPARPPTTRRRILIVEDESLVALDLAHSLYDLGFDVLDTVATGSDALRAAAEHRPDLALVDIRIQGDQDGIDTAAVLRRRFHLPVVYLTAHADDKTLERAVRTEPYGYLLKPFNPKELKSVMEVALYKHDAEMRLRESEESLYTTLNSIADAVIAADTRGRITRMNPVASRLTGWPLADARGLQLEEVFRIHSEGAPEPEESPARRALREGVVVGLTDHAVLVARDGSERPIADSAAPILAADDSRHGVVLVFRDQTAERRAEECERAHAERLRRSQAQLAEAQRIAHVGSWEWDLTANTASWSDELFHLLGRDPRTGPVSYALLLECVHPEDREPFDAGVHAAIGERQRFSLEHRIVRPSGEVRILHSDGQAFRDEGGKPVRVAATAQDLTEQRTLEKQVLIAGGLAAVGTLASGIAHEINNPLMYVIGNVDLATERISAMIERLERTAGEARAIEGSKDMIDGLREMHELLRQAAHGAERVCRIIRDLKVFSRAEPRKISPVAIAPVLDSSISLCWNEIRYRAQLVKDLAEVPLVAADESRLGQVFVNLLVNAAHAIPEGRSQEHEIRISTRTDEGGHAVVEVRDTGMGIPQAIISNIFDPFFTTKPIGVGTGLGLSICHGIITGLGGQLEVESELGRGSLFRLVLPPAEGAPACKQPPLPARPPAYARILVIDNDPLVAGTLSRMLPAEHEVVTLTSAKAALALLTSDEHFDLVLCDVMMPEMTAMDLHERVAVESPATAKAMVFMTGGAFTPRARDFLEHVPNLVIQKPFDQRTLQDMINRSLHRS